MIMSEISKLHSPSQNQNRTHNFDISIIPKNQRPEEKITLNMAAKSKSEALKLKKQQKNQLRKPSLEYVEQQKLKKKTQKLQGLQVSQNQNQKNLNSKLIVESQQTSMPYSLEKLVKRPSYITLSKGNIITGSLGHGSAVFKRPIIEGQVFIEFVIRQDKICDKKPLYDSSIRFGICNAQFNFAFPLGYKQSIGYKCSNGAIVRQGEEILQTEGAKTGDIIGIFIKKSPPKKHSKQTDISLNSSVSFYKNSILLASITQLKEIFYCFAVSFFNYSQVEVLYHQKKRMPENSQHYFDTLSSAIQYKDLAEKKIFKL